MVMVVWDLSLSTESQVSLLADITMSSAWSRSPATPSPELLPLSNLDRRRRSQFSFMTL